jgi:peptidoglycan hydrolase CwlO-like protein
MSDYIKALEKRVEELQTKVEKLSGDLETANAKIDELEAARYHYDDPHDDPLGIL